MPPEKEFAREVLVVVGAGSGIGRAVAGRVAKEGAHVVCADLDEAAAQETADGLTDLYGVGIGVAGTGVSSCGPAIAAGVDVTKRDSVHALFNTVLRAYGGIDRIIVTAGVFFAPDKDGQLDDDKWALTYAINVTGMLPRCRRGAARLGEAGVGREPGADHQRQRRRAQKRLARLRHLQGGGEPPRARARGRARAPHSRQRPGTGDGGGGQQHVRAGARDKLARQVRHPLQRGRERRVAAG